MMDITPSLEMFLLVAAAVTATGGLIKWLRPKWRKTKREVVAAKDSLLGREAKHDSITGKEVLPALPGIGQRMAVIENALTQLVDLHHRLDEHSERLEALERKDMERALARTESIEMLRTIETAIQSTPREK